VKTYGLTHEQLAMVSVVQREWAAKNSRATFKAPINVEDVLSGGDFIPGPHYDRYLDLIARQVQISSDMLAMTKTYCDRRANLDVADIKKQVQFWQDRGRLDKRIVVADLLDLSFIGDETIAP
jgi:acetyl-CoA acetyltransferase